MAECLRQRAWAFLHGHGLGSALATPSWVNHQPESRMRENRRYGSEGGGRYSELPPEQEARHRQPCARTEEQD